MDLKATSSKDSEKSSSLFPAYASIEKIDDSSVHNEAWLCNSSFTPTNYKEAVAEYGKSQLASISEKPKLPTDDFFEESSKKKKQKKKNLYKAPPDVPKIPEKDSIRSHLNKKTFIEETGLSFERAFRVDTKFDYENFHFDCFERTKIAKYKLKPVTPVGLSDKEKPFWIVKDSKKNKNKTNRYFNQKFLKNINNLDTETITINKVSAPEEFSHDFILLPSSESKVNKMMQGTVCFDGISSGWKTECNVKPNETALKKDKIAPDIPLDFREKIIFYNKMLSESPHDIQMWLDFVDFQDELFRLEQKSNISYGATESSIIEKKMSILDKALKINPESILLTISKLQLAQSIWKVDKLITEWENLLSSNALSTDLWQGYLHFILTNLICFNSSFVQKTYSKCISTLSKLSEGQLKSHHIPPDIKFSLINIFSQLCFILKSMGYTEKSVALYQALIELNVFCEASLKDLTSSDKITCFEPFWDSGAPRIGEEGAIGWAATVLEKKVCSDKLVAQSDLNNLEDEILYQELSLNKTWRKFEKLRGNHNWLPWRPNPQYDQTEEDIDDIDRCISFDDISKFLFSISSEEHTFFLVQKAVNFLEFNFHLLECSSFMNGPCNQVDIEQFYKVSKELRNSIFKNQVLNSLNFKASKWTDDKINFVNNIFYLVKNKFSVKYKVLLNRLWLKFRRYLFEESKTGLTKNSDSLELKTFAKDMLKISENRNCLLLWSEYIQAEWLFDKIKAKKTFLTLFTSSSVAASCGNLNMKEMWHFILSFINTSFGLLEQSSETNGISREEIIWILMHIGCKEKYVPYSGQIVKPPVLLKAISGFKGFIDEELQNLTLNNWICYCVDPCSYSIVDCARCYAYLLYFSQGIDAAIQALKSVVISLESSNISQLCKRIVIEHFNVFQVQLRNFNTWNSNESLNSLKINLQEFIELYPSNSQLLLLLVKLRSASCVVNPSRRFWARILKEQNKLLPITWLFAIASELSINYFINQAQNFELAAYNVSNNSSCLGVTWKIRALYEKALKSLLCISIPILWRSYIKFEVLNQDMQRAKGIFYRALQSCGWCKNLLLDGIKYFPDDLKQIVDFMNEKQIRVHTPLEEITLLMEHAIKE